MASLINKKRLIKVLEMLLKMDDIEIIKCVIESIIEELKDKALKNADQ